MKKVFLCLYLIPLALYGAVSCSSPSSTSGDSVGSNNALSKVGDFNPNDPNDPNNGDPNNGDPNNGDPNSGDPNNGDPNNGDPNNPGTDPAAADPPVNVPVPPNALNPSGHIQSFLDDPFEDYEFRQLYFWNNNMWRDPVCEPINPRTTIQKGDLVIAMNNIRKPYTLYKRKAKLRALQEKFSDYIQDEIMPHMVSKYQSVKSLAKTRLPAGNGEAVNNAVAKKIAMRNLDANVDVPLKKRDASKLFLLNAHQANLSSGKPKTGWVSALTFVRIVPKYRQGVGARACEDFCVKYEKALLDTYYSKRWDPVIEQKCKRFHESVFGLNPMDLNFNRATDPLTDIPFGIHVAPYMLYLTERKLKLKWTQDFLRRIYFKIPGKQPVAWEDIIASYYGSPDKANLANQSHKESLAELRDMLEDEPYKYYTDLLGPEGLGTLNHIGIGISYVDQDPAIAIIVILFTPEHIY